MLKYIGKRIIMMIPVLLGVITLIFLILHFSPGDPARMQLGEAATEEAVQALRKELGLDQPVFLQFVRYLGGLLKGDFGTSYTTRTPVVETILSRYPATLTLAGLSVLIMVVVGIPIGIISATRQYSLLDRVSTGVALLGVSMPTFWIGMLLVMFFSLRLGWLPVSGFYGPKYWILPAFSIGINSAAIIMRMTRSSMLEVIRSDYIRTARAKGQSERRVVMHHALKNALVPIITVIGVQLGIQLGGAMVTEAVFSIPGLGSYMLDAIKMRDYPVVQGGIIFIAITFSFINLLVDVAYSFIDPRIRAQYRSSTKPKREAAAE